MSNKVCPYPGLRPFTVDESFFFKGRDLHVRQIINKLETNKILILTGASGDGKSSLVYAGLIPSAKAGFFRSKYNRWVFADFRPERSPLKNLAASLSSALKLDYNETEQELGYGFSAIIDLYKSSQYYFDENSSEAEQLKPEQKRKRTMASANLFILADQFEELFTNSENYANGKASVEAYTCVNLLLETAKIALRDNLPIYIICTLRSDFISQCIAFRGLPEAIGFSQFFVPRLNRSELQQVIEEPALLSGGKVSKRLKEILINELHDGFDQLPILQHTLKQVWWAAGNGEEVLDMIHLAKLGGIHSRFLTDQDKIHFDKWVETIAPVFKNYLTRPSSNNVLNAHADYLYESAHQHYIKETPWGEKNISEEDAKLVVKVAFQCLTKIDQGRAVRNRTTLEEITHIVDRPHIKYETVCGIINIFRLHSSTFLRPFINENDIATQYLSYDTVLDITHESLIRNWENLKKWNEEETTNVSDFNEFKVQLGRWLENDRSKDFLLAIGPLSHFEVWYNRCKPNKYWLAKYDSSTTDYRERLKITEALAIQCKEFLTISREYFIQTEKTKRWRKNIALISAIIVIIALSAFSYVAKKEKRNAEIQRVLAEKQTDLAKDEQQKAIEANKIADKERKLAQLNANSALFAKAQSDSARNQADILRKISENATALAYREKDNATAEKERAEQQKTIAEQQRQRAILASDSAQMLSYLATAQSLSYKTTQKYEDKQLNLLLALQCYKYNERYHGYAREPFVYHALSVALKKNGMINLYNVSKESYSSSSFSKSGISIFTKKGKLILYDQVNSKILKETQLFNGLIPINYSVFLTNSILVAVLENKEAYYIDLNTNNKIKLIGHSDYIRGAYINPSKTLLATCGRDQLVQVYKIENKSVNPISVYRMDARVTAVVLLPDNETMFASTIYGTINRINISTGTVKTEAKISSSALSMALSPDNRFLTVGSADGMIHQIDTQGKMSREDFPVGNSGLRQIVYQHKLNLLALAFDDKTVKIYSMNNLEKQAINLRDIDQKIMQIGFIDERLFALLADNTLEFWETDFNIYAKQVEKLLTRNFTTNEWRMFVGEKVPYEKTINK